MRHQSSNHRLFSINFPLPTANCCLPSALRALRSAFCALRSALCQLSIAFCALVFCLLFSSDDAAAQSWRWGKNGGSNSGGVYSDDETVIDMATDPNGNVYVLSHVYESVAGPYTFNVAGHTQNAYGLQDISVTSFSCNGSYRWSKTFGSEASDYATSIKTDSLGGVYITGKIESPGIGSGYFDSDTTIAGDKSFFIIKYDTAGQYQWLRMPEDNPPLYGSYYAIPCDIDVDGAGNMHILSYLYAGSYGNGGLVTTDTSYYILKYNNAGIFQNAISLPIDGYGVTWYMKMDFSLKRYYITGRCYLGNPTINNIPLSSHLFIAAFDSAGNYLWHRKNSPTANTYGFFRPAIDQQHNIYLSGGSSHNDTFNNYVVVNTLTTAIHGLPFIVKLDTNGNNIWAINGSVNGATAGNSIAIGASNEVFVEGSYPGKLVFAGYDSLQHIMNQGFDIFLLRLNATTGAVTGLDSISSSFGSTEEASAIVADKKDNVYVSGFFQNDMEIGNDTIVKSGGPGDFFVAKFGFDNCNCVSTPVASFSYTGVNPLVFSFTGTQPADSIVWNFGDGNYATGPTASHSYAADGSYQACATVYSPCGIDSSCQTIIITDIASLSRDGYGMKVYPNPAQQNTRIDYSLSDNGGGVIEVYDMVGRKMAQHQLSNQRGSWQLSLEGYSAGLYMVVLKQKGMVVKQSTLSVVH